MRKTEMEDKATFRGFLTKEAIDTEAWEEEETEKVILCFRDSNEDHPKCVQNRISVPTKVLMKSDFLRTRLSEPWSRATEEKTAEIALVLSCDFSVYLKCLQFLCCPKSFALCSVNEALDVLHVSCEWLVHDCIQMCLDYLQTVRWTEEDEIKIREALSTLQIKPPYDLSQRICNAGCPIGCVHITMLHNTLTDLMSLCIAGDPDAQVPGSRSFYSSFERVLNKFMVDCFRKDADSEISRCCQEIVAKSFRKSMRKKDWSAMKWLLKLSECCSAEMHKLLIEIYAAESNTTLLDWYLNFGRKIVDFIDFHSLALKSLSEGKAVSAISDRFLFVKKCMIPLSDIISKSSGESPDGKIIEIMKRGIEAAQTLALQEQMEIFCLLKDVAITDLLENDKDNENSSATTETIEWWIHHILQSHRSHSSFSRVCPPPLPLPDCAALTDAWRCRTQSHACSSVKSAVQASFAAAATTEVPAISVPLCLQNADNT